MSAKSILALIGIGGIGFAAYKSGLIGGGGAADVEAVPTDIHDVLSAADPVALLGRDEVVQVPRCEAVLRRNEQYVQAWARYNRGWAAAIMQVESAGRVSAIGDNGHAFGLYQVHIGTAETCYRAGYNGFNPTRETLMTEAGAVYFGTAEMDRLSRISDNLDWIICAYNGGAGWREQGADYVRLRLAYLQRVKSAFASMYGRLA